MNIPTSQLLLRRINVGNCDIAYKISGEGTPVLFIHGSWDDHHSWSGISDRLQDQFKVISYDRRGHSASSKSVVQGRVSEDVDDALKLIKKLNIGPVHLVGHSYGANVAIALASSFPESTLSLYIHEPPIFGLLKGSKKLEAMRTDSLLLMKKTAALIESGEVESAARLFIEKIAFGQDSWTTLFDERARAVILSNVDTWLDQFKDPERLAIDITQLTDYPNKITLSKGTLSFDTYKEVTRKILEKLPSANVTTIKGGAHGSPVSHPELVYKALIKHLTD